MDILDNPVLRDRIKDITQNRRIRLLMKIGCLFLEESVVLKFLDTVKGRDAEFDARYSTWYGENPQKRNMTDFIKMIANQSQPQER